MSDPRNVAHDKKTIQEKHKHGAAPAQGAAHIPQPGKKMAREKPHGAHVETEAEEGGNKATEATEKPAGADQP